jgi:hypothetical protein
MINNFAVGVPERLARLLAFIGRPRAHVEYLAEGMIEISDGDGRCTVYAPRALTNLDKMAQGDGAEPDFWLRVQAAP